MDMYAASAMFGFATFIGLVLFLAIAIPFLLTLQNCLKAVSLQNRRMPPGQVWLLLIPLFNIVWMFIVVLRIAESLEAEYMMRGMPVDNKPTQGVGLGWAILSACSFIPFLGTLSSIGALVCWIIYWVKVAEHKNRLQGLPEFTAGESSIF